MRHTHLITSHHSVGNLWMCSATPRVEVVSSGSQSFQRGQIEIHRRLASSGPSKATRVVGLPTLHVVKLDHSQHIGDHTYETLLATLAKPRDIVIRPTKSHSFTCPFVHCNRKSISELNLQVLDGSACTIAGVKFYGSPLQPRLPKPRSFGHKYLPKAA